MVCGGLSFSHTDSATVTVRLSLSRETREHVTDSDTVSDCRH